MEWMRLRCKVAIIIPIVNYMFSFRSVSVFFLKYSAKFHAHQLNNAMSPNLQTTKSARQRDNIHIFVKFRNIFNRSWGGKKFLYLYYLIVDN
eukprot:snap_masked-scaffold_7-processed-gene-3.42-mRNA-1 protein AED:1.00 eAED:1.00 QI:0/0/0/0/1/1/2/0/91